MQTVTIMRSGGMTDLILFLIEEYPTDNYRLRSYDNFCNELIKEHPNTVISVVSKDKDIFDIIENECGGVVPKSIFMMNGSIKPSDFTKLDSKVYVFTTDAILPPFSSPFHRDKMAHNVNFTGVFHNYIYGSEYLQKEYSAEKLIHFPCWSSEEYDFETSRQEKKFNFLLSGQKDIEYEYRPKFSSLLKDLDEKSYVDKLGIWANDKTDNDTFLELLLCSKWSPHDGGFNGRMVPRYFESGYAKTVIISPDLGEEMKVNGYVNDENCILFDRNAPREDVLKILNSVSDEKWNRLANNAYELVKERHSTKARLKVFLEELLN